MKRLNQQQLNINSRSETINLGDPLPLTYTPIKNQSNHSHNRSNSNNPAEPILQQRDQTFQPIRKISPIIRQDTNHLSNVQDFIKRRRISPRPTIHRTKEQMLSQQSHDPSLVLKNIQKKLQLINQNFTEKFDHLQNESINLEIIELKLKEIEEILAELDPIQDQEVDNVISKLNEEQEEEQRSEVDVLFRELNIVKSELKQRKLKYNILSNILNFITLKKWWIINISIFLTLFFLTSIYASEFKYRYCYYFC
ncbi:uncharacterized protein KGF55_001460 [Candida pseudojiufengensis]|uniref:uncharacterized protein n=1 Tax=Candida pseudojiufengensis TaxID=497109 RepID=UPI0022258765|nr:uncharacterized protein KGF55_001460 [Candida pseudojiufengensis]KAI5965240.1 hypothetical protein KGF55_001460 [Candida pseudojiufengensis]